MTPGADIPEFPSAVLLVDDEPVILHLLSEIFSARGMTIHTADTGEKAIEILETTGIACLLSDKNLPGIGGLEVIQTTRELQPFCACILMTAFSSTESAVEALRLGAMDYLEKPFEDLDLVAQKVDKAIESQRAQFDRHALLERIRAYHSQLTEKEAEVDKRRSEVEMFEKVLDARIREATDDLRRKAKHFKNESKERGERLTKIAEQAAALLETARGSEGIGGDGKERLATILEELRATAAGPQT